MYMYIINGQNKYIYISLKLRGHHISVVNDYADMFTHSQDIVSALSIAIRHRHKKVSRNCFLLVHKKVEILTNEKGLKNHKSMRGGGREEMLSPNRRLQVSIYSSKIIHKKDLCLPISLSPLLYPPFFVLQSLTTSFFLRTFLL